MKKILFILLVALVSCSSPEQGDIKVINVDLSSTENVLLTSDVASESSLIIVETSDTSHLIGAPISVVEQGNYLYIADDASIFMIDKSGKILNTISKKGKGPDEYLMIADIQIDEQGRLWVLCRDNKTLYCYSWESGELVKKVTTDAWLIRMKYVGDDKMLCFIGNEMDDKNAHQLRTIDLNTGEVVQRELPIDEKQAEYLHWMMRNHFTADGGKTYFYEPFCDTLYCLDEHYNLKPSKYVDLGGKGIPRSFFDEDYYDVRDFYIHLSEKGYAYGINMFLTSGAKCLFTFTYDGEYRWYADSANGGRGGKALVEDILLEGYEFDMNNDVFCVQDNGVLIVALSPFMVIETMKGKVDGDTLELLKKKLGYMGDDQNPVLFRMKL